MEDLLRVLSLWLSSNHLLPRKKEIEEKKPRKNGIKGEKTTEIEEEYDDKHVMKHTRVAVSRGAWYKLVFHKVI